MGQTEQYIEDFEAGFCFNSAPKVSFKKAPIRLLTNPRAAKTKQVSLENRNTCKRWSMRRDLQYAYKTARYNMELWFFETSGPLVHPRSPDLDSRIPGMKSGLDRIVHSLNKKMIRRSSSHTPISIFTAAFIKSVFNKVMTIKAQCLLLYVTFGGGRL